VKTYLETRHTIESTNAKGEREKTVVAESEKRDLDKILADYQPEEKAEAVKHQSFQYSEAETPEDFEELIPDASKRVAVFNRGWVLAQQGVIRDFMLNDEPVREGAYDLRADAVEGIGQRRKATPEDKAKKQLDAVLLERGPDALKEIIAAYTAQLQSMEGNQAAVTA
jgi:3-oxoacyl-ACP reductase-like protein